MAVTINLFGEIISTLPELSGRTYKTLQAAKNAERFKRNWLRTIAEEGRANTQVVNIGGHQYYTTTMLQAMGLLSGPSWKSEDRAFELAIEHNGSPIPLSELQAQGLIDEYGNVIP